MCSNSTEMNYFLLPHLHVFEETNTYYKAIDY